MEQCSWMKKPPHLRYPRHPSPYLPDPSVTTCMNRLWQWQENGELYFVLYEGLGLAAITSGGFHGNSDDNDIDIKMASRLYPSYNDHCHPHPGALFGMYGYKKLPARGAKGYTEDDVRDAIFDMHKHPRTAGRNEAGFVPCLCEFEGLEVFCIHEKSDYMQWLHGGSWWVPPVSGMKDAGVAFKEYMNPGHFGEGVEELWTNFDKYELSRDGLLTIDANSDDQIDNGEFLKFVRANPKVNQAWVEATLKNNRCLVTNAYIHYNHTLFYSVLGSKLRYACGDTQGYPDNYHTCRRNSAWKPACGPKECHLEAWKTYQDHWVEPAYVTPCAMG